MNVEILIDKSSKIAGAVIMAFSRFFASRLGNEFPVYPPGSFNNQKDLKITIPGSGHE